MIIVAIALATIGLLLFLLAYIMLLLIPITVETWCLIRLRRRSFNVSAQLEAGHLQLGSPEYWMAIERLLPEGLSDRTEPLLHRQQKRVYYFELLLLR